MIKAIVTKQNCKYKSFSCSGHAGYADSGEDIVCSAVSMLVINTANAIEKFTDDYIIGKDLGNELYFEFPDGISSDGELLMNALILGLENVIKKYGNDYLILETKEV